MQINISVIALALLTMHSTMQTIQRIDDEEIAEVLSKNSEYAKEAMDYCFQQGAELALKDKRSGKSSYISDKPTCFQESYFRALNRLYNSELFKETKDSKNK